MLVRPRVLVLLSFATLLLAACSGSDAAVGPADSAVGVTALASIQPLSSAINVDPNVPVVLRFSHAMMTGMEMLVVLHEAGVTGPVVAATGTWSADRTTLTLVPQAPLKRLFTYVVHLSPSLKDASGRAINMSSGTMMGGRTVSGGMMGSGSMMNGQWGPGMMGAGWQATNGTFGMSFTFTTA